MGKFREAGFQTVMEEWPDGLGGLEGHVTTIQSTPSSVSTTRDFSAKTYQRIDFVVLNPRTLQRTLWILNFRGENWMMKVTNAVRWVVPCPRSPYPWLIHFAPIFRMSRNNRITIGLVVFIEERGNYNSK
jgi:hypothetical protein